MITFLYVLLMTFSRTRQEMTEGSYSWTSIEGNAFNTKETEPCLTSQKNLMKCYENFNEATNGSERNSLRSCCQFSWLKECLRTPFDVCGRNYSVEISSLNSKIPECSTYRYPSTTCVFYFYWPYFVSFMVVVVFLALFIECFMFEGEHLDPLIFKVWKKQQKALEKHNKECQSSSLFKIHHQTLP